MATNTDRDRVWELMDNVSFCMLATQDGDHIRARPMAPYLRPAENAIYFLADVKHHKDDEIQRSPNVCLTFADSQFVSLTGRAEVSNDRTKIKELFGTAAKAWWDSPDDPSIRVLKVTPQHAEYWDTPGPVVGYAKMAIAAVTGAEPDYGENRKVAMGGR